MDALWIELTATAALSALLVWAAMPLLVRALLSLGALDLPNQRSSHASPTPRGAGILLVAAIVLVGGFPLALSSSTDVGSWVALGAALALAVLSFADDLVSLSAGVRLSVQAAAVAAGVAVLPDHVLVAQGLLPLALDRLVAALAWLWFVNLFNFMDGIDGITGAETIAIALGLALVFALLPVSAVPSQMLVLLAAIGGAAAGFLIWNWPPARVFLGDVGSIPLGYLLGWMLVWLAGSGAWAAALILPLYYLADASVTLVRRLARREKVWQAHREHFYQLAARAGWPHDLITLRITWLNLGLIGLAVVSVTATQAWVPWLCLAAATLLSGWRLYAFARATPQ